MIDNYVFCLNLGCRMPPRFDAHGDIEGEEER